jgi:NitT/TauT family transport system permease protein
MATSAGVEEPAATPKPGWQAPVGRLTVTLLPIVCFFLIWEAAVQLGLVKAALLSPPSVAIPALVDYFTTGDIFPHLWASLQRGGTGFLIAAAVGVPLGLIIGSLKVVARALTPVIEFLRQLPPLAMLPVFLLFLGLGFRAQLGIVIWASIWPILLNTITGAQAVDPRLVKAARTLGARRSDLFLRVALPSALPTIMTGMRLGASYAFLVLVAAEMVGADSGLGFLILNNQYTFRIPQMYAAILILACFGVALNYGLVALERLLTPWRQHV